MKPAVFAATLIPSKYPSVSPVTPKSATLTALVDAVVTTTTAETAMKFVGNVSELVPVVAPFATVKLFSITSKPISVICFQHCFC